MTTRYDVVWYWVGGTERGRWFECPWTPDARENVERSGYVAVEGRRSIGKPDTPPSAASLRRVLVANVEHLAAQLAD